MREALGGLQFVDKSQPIYADIRTRKAAFTVAPGQAFNAEETKKALDAAGFHGAKVLKEPKQAS